MKLPPVCPFQKIRNVVYISGILGAGIVPVLAGSRESFNDDWKFQRSDGASWGAAQIDYAVLKPYLLASSAKGLRALTAAPAFPLQPFGKGAEEAQLNFDDRLWRSLSVPHDWGIEGPFKQELPGETGKLEWWGRAWYRKHFRVSEADQVQRVSLELDGVMSCSSVWINGHLVGGWPSGYTSYSVDLTPWLQFGAENVIAVHVDNPPDSSRWYPGGGIYRNVWLVKNEPVHVTTQGVSVSTPRVTSSEAVVSVNTLISNEAGRDEEVEVECQLFLLNEKGEAGSEPVAAATIKGVKIGAGNEVSTTSMIKVANPKLWDLEHPVLYSAVSRVISSAKREDTVKTSFGIRSAVFDPDKGFLLNGVRVPLNGVCLHHDLGALGAAISRRAMERRLELLKSAGCNAIRTSHNPPAPEFLDLCDRMGFLVLDEAFDCWTKGKTRNDYHRYFQDWAERDLRALVRRDRNHPSVIMWSIGNEVQDQHDPEGWRIGAMLAGIVREEDRTRPVTSGLDGVASGYRGLQMVQDVFGYNYKPWEYERFHAAYPTIPLFGSETASTISTRGEYFFPVSDDPLDKASRVDFQLNSYDMSAEAWATTPEVEWKGQGAGPFVAGEFVWTGFDYLGESTPFLVDATNPLRFTDPAKQSWADETLRTTGKIPVPSRSSYFGIFDLAGLPKDRFFLYQARWRPDFPMVHVLPHWTWPGREGQVTPVHVYTTGDEAELFLNGHSLGRKTKGRGASRLRWDDVQYAAGELKVVAYKNGTVWSQEIVKTAGPAAAISLQADRQVLEASEEDLAFVTLSVLDGAGTLVPKAANRIRLSVTGAATLVAVDNGDPTSHDSFHSSEYPVFHGKLVAVVKSKKGEAGEIKLQVESDGLKPAELLLRSSVSKP